ncbi:MAG: DNA-deoxyinosine glycosylase [Clostridia bacterium]|nr:DNA-deoxyinosine glycosylase [Clostridia bacterium]
MKTKPQALVHPIPPLYNEDSRLLILGSFPSPKSREARFFYGHPQNRFWPLLARLLDEAPPQSVEEKATLALSHHIALWDSIASCTIVGASDSSVKDVKPNDLSGILHGSWVAHIACNGALSYTMYMRHLFPATGIEAIRLPSTSPANAAFSMERLAEAWRVILPILDT